MRGNVDTFTYTIYGRLIPFFHACTDSNWHHLYNYMTSTFSNLCPTRFNYMYKIQCNFQILICILTTTIFYSLNVYHMLVCKYAFYVYWIIFYYKIQVSQFSFFYTRLIQFFDNCMVVWWILRHYQDNIRMKITNFEKKKKIHAISDMEEDLAKLCQEFYDTGLTDSKNHLHILLTTHTKYILRRN